MSSNRLSKALDVAYAELLRQSNVDECPYVGTAQDWPREIVLDGRFDMEALVKAVLAES